MRPSLSRSFALLTVLLFSTMAHAAAKTIVISSFAGPRGEEAAERIGKALRGLKGVRVMSPAAFASAKQKLGSDKAGSDKAGSALGVAMLGGSVSRVRGQWALRIVVKDLAGRTKTSQTFQLRDSRVDPSTAASATRFVVSALSRFGPVRRARPRKRPERPQEASPSAPPPPAAPATQPALPMGPAPEGEFEVDEAIGDDFSGRPVGGDHEAADPTNEMGFVVTSTRAGGAQRAEAPAPKRPRYAALAPRAPSGAHPTRTRAPVEPRVASDLGADPEAPPLRAPRERALALNAEAATMVREVPEEDENAPGEGDAAEAEHRAWIALIKGSAGLALINRSMKFSGTRDAGYTTPALIPALYAGGLMFPLSPFFDNWLGDLGVAARFYHAVGLHSEARGGARSQSDILQTFDIGPRFRWSLFDDAKAPVLLFGLDLGYQAFRHRSAQPVFPDVLYLYAEPNVAVDWPFLALGSVRGGATIELDIPIVSSPQPVKGANIKYGPTSSIFAFELNFGFYASFSGFFGQLDVFYRHFQMKFDSSGCAASGCREASGARDVYLGLMLHAGYTY